MASDTSISPAQLNQMVRAGVMTPGEAEQLYMATLVPSPGVSNESLYSTASGFTEGGVGSPYGLDATSYEGLVQQARFSSSSPIDSSSGLPIPDLSHLTPEELFALTPRGAVLNATGLQREDSPSETTLNPLSNVLLHSLVARQMGVSFGVREGMARYSAARGLGTSRWDAARAGGGEARQAVRTQGGLREIRASGLSVNEFNTARRIGATVDDIGGAVLIRPSMVRNGAGKAVNWATGGRYGSNWIRTASTGTETAARTGGRAVATATAEAGAKATGEAAAKGAAKGLGRLVPGLSIGIAALDSYEAGKIQSDPNASGGKKALGWVTAGLSCVAAGASNIPVVGTAVAAVASVAATVTGFFRDILD